MKLNFWNLWKFWIICIVFTAFLISEVKEISGFHDRHFSSRIHKLHKVVKIIKILLCSDSFSAWWWKVSVDIKVWPFSKYLKVSVSKLVLDLKMWWTIFVLATAFTTPYCHFFAISITWLSQKLDYKACYIFIVVALNGFMSPEPQYFFIVVNLCPVCFLQGTQWNNTFIYYFDSASE